jgi:DNA-damage-inducible protein J
MTNINIRTDSELKAEAQSVLSDLGLDMTTAINVFLNQVVYRQAIPFEIAKPVIKYAKLGGWEGKIAMSADFNEPADEFAGMVHFPAAVILDGSEI